jgi:hypothetical protein
MTDIKKGRKFVVLILMTVVNVAYVIGCAIQPKLIELMFLMITIAGVYAAYMGINVAQKNIEKKK